MALNVQLEALTVPFGTEFPGTIQGLLELIAQYEQIVGLEDFNGINFGSTEPDEDNRDKPWFKTDDDGDPLGWFAWNGSAWTAIPIVIQSGTTSERPVNAVVGQQFLDTDIDVMLVYERSQWRTLSGSPGDVKEVKAATIEAALTKNPGWLEDADSVGRVVVGVSDGSGFTYEETGGVTEVTLTTNQLPAHTHNTPWKAYSGSFQNGSQPAGVFPLVTGTGDTPTESTGSAEAHTNLQPYICYWRLVKS